MTDDWDNLPTVGDDGGEPKLAYKAPPAVTEAQINPFGLTERELAFAYACVELDDRAEAAATLDDKNPERLARLLWDKPRVRRMIELIARERGGAAVVAPSEIINRLASIAEANIVDAFKMNRSGKLIVKQLHEMSPALLTGIKKIRIQKGVIEIELHDKLKAIEMIGRYQGLWSGKGSGGDKPVQSAPRTIRGSYEERLAQHGSTISTGLAGPPVDVADETELAG